MILLIDNYDSFTFNLYQYLGELGEDIMVRRNDQITLGEIEELKPDGIVLSPGPGRPENAGVCVDVVKEFHSTVPILGICLGHQAIGYAFGAEIKKADRVMHGKISKITHTETEIFAGLTGSLETMRYHSLVIDKDSLPENFEVTGTSNDDEEIMAMKHKEYPVYGLQFHPESIGTDTGKKMLKNFTEEIRGGVRQ